MTKLVWDSTGDKIFETGVDRGVLYPPSAPCVPWNGLTDVTNKSSDVSIEPYYADGKKYIDLIGIEDFSATLEAYTYPDEFCEFDGVQAVDSGHGLLVSQQQRKYFGLSYRTGVGNDVDGVDYGYKIHIIYKAIATPSDKAWQSIGESPEATTFSWDLSTLPVAVPGLRPSAHFIIDTQKMNKWAVMAIEEFMYGGDYTDGALPTLDDLLMLSQIVSPFQIFDMGDGTWRAYSFDGTVHNIKTRSYGIRYFDITWDDIVDVGDGSYLITTP